VSGARVLVVDDSDVTRAMITRALGRAGFAVLEARDGIDGAVQALRDRPSLVITDLEMPTMDGYQLLRLLKSDPSTAHIPVVILTSHGEAPSRFWGYRTGADGYLTKDHTSQELLAVVKSLATAVTEPRPFAGPPPQTATDVLARVARSLDDTLLRATFLNTLLERGIAADDFAGAVQVALATTAEVVDAYLLAVGVVESQLVTLHLLLPQPVAEVTVERFANKVLSTLPSVPGATVEVVVHGDRDGPARPPLDGLVALPLQLHGATGTLVLLPRDASQFDQLSRPLVEPALGTLALVLDNSRLAQRLKELSMLDGLTRQLNHRAIHERLVEELKRAQRYRHSLSVIICDLDHFKIVNDTHGHLAGDAALLSAATTMRSTLRGGDAFGRFGGEEFLAVLPETDLDSARHAAERLRRSLVDTPIAVPSGRNVTVTGSFGVASAEELGTDASADALISLADTRLYQSKAAGRNCVRP